MCLTVFSADARRGARIYVHVSNNVRRRLHGWHRLRYDRRRSQHSLLERREQKRKQLQFRVSNQVAVTCSTSRCQQTACRQPRERNDAAETINSGLASIKNTSFNIVPRPCSSQRWEFLEQ